MAPKGPTLRVTHMFRLLTFLGVPQAAVSRRLGVHKSLVSRWAAGRWPMPQRYVFAVFDLINEATAAAATRPDTPPEFFEQVGRLIDDWKIEIGETYFVAEIAEQCRILARDGTDPDKLRALLQSPEGPRIRQAFETGLRNLRWLDRLYTPAPVELLKQRLRPFMPAEMTTEAREPS